MRDDHLGGAGEGKRSVDRGPRAVLAGADRHEREDELVVVADGNLDCATGGVLRGGAMVGLPDCTGQDAVTLTLLGSIPEGVMPGRLQVPPPVT